VQDRSLVDTYIGTNIVADGANEAQTVTVTGSPTGGTFTLTYSGQTTAAIAYNASALVVQQRLFALSNIEEGQVRSPAPTAARTRSPSAVRSTSRR
jgi:fermentation-respiration switch protein FrsA (DUF1100 family)